MIIYMSLAIMFLAFLLSNFAGKKKSSILLVLAWFVFLFGSVICLFIFLLETAESGPSCRELGGRYELDEVVRSEGGPATEVYKCVRN